MSNKGNVLNDITEFKTWLDYKREVISKWASNFELKDELLNEIEKASQLEAFNESEIQGIVNHIDVKVNTKMTKGMEMALTGSPDSNFMEQVADFKYLNTKAFGENSCFKVLEVIKANFGNLQKISDDDPIKLALNRCLEQAIYSIKVEEYETAWIYLARFSFCYNDKKEYLYNRDQSSRKTNIKPIYAENKDLLTDLIIRCIGKEIIHKVAQRNFLEQTGSEIPRRTFSNYIKNYRDCGDIFKTK